MAYTRNGSGLSIEEFLDQPVIITTESGHWCGKASFNRGIYLHTQNNVTTIWLTHDPNFPANNALDTSAEVEDEVVTRTQVKIPRNEPWVPIEDFLDQPELFHTRSGYFCGKAVLKDGFYFNTQNGVTTIWVTHDPQFSVNSALGIAVEAGTGLEEKADTEVKTRAADEVVTEMQVDTEIMIDRGDHGGQIDGSRKDDRKTFDQQQGTACHAYSSSADSNKINLVVPGPSANATAASATTADAAFCPLLQDKYNSRNLGGQTASCQWKRPLPFGPSDAAPKSKRRAMMVDSTSSPSLPAANGSVSSPSASAVSVVQQVLQRAHDEAKTMDTPCIPEYLDQLAQAFQKAF